MSREDKYQIILDAAVEAFAQYGYFSCQVSKIAKIAGVADGTIYLYFKNKEDILVSLFNERMGDFIKVIRQNLDFCQNTGERLNEIIKSHLGYMQENRSLAIVVQIELRQSLGPIREAISAPVREYFHLIEEILKKGVEEEEIFLPDVKVGRQLIFGTLDAVLSDWVLAKNPRRLDTDAIHIFELFKGAFRIQ